MQYLTTKLVPILKVGKWYKGHYCILHRIWNTESRFKYYFNVKFIEVINYCGYVRVSLLENTLQYFSVKGQNVWPMESRALWATVHMVAKSWT